MRNWIGYPDDILDNDHMNEIYENVSENGTCICCGNFLRLKAPNRAKMN